LTGINFPKPSFGEQSFRFAPGNIDETAFPELAKIDGRHGRFGPRDRNLSMMRQPSASLKLKAPDVRHPRHRSKRRR
jgi:hypothetical protein